MDKREELEWAAKVMGLSLHWRYPVDADLFPVKTDPEVPRVRHYPAFIDAEGFSVEWNPEHDKATAFELMVALGMRVTVAEKESPSPSSEAALPRGISISVPHAGSPEAATRLAILRAACEAGKQRASK